MQPMNSCLYGGTEEIQSQEGGLCQAVRLPWGPGRTRAGSCICRVGGLPVGTTPAKATGLTGAAARRGWAGPGRASGRQPQRLHYRKPSCLTCSGGQGHAEPVGRHGSQAPGELVWIFTLRKPYFSTKFL